MIRFVLRPLDRFGIAIQIHTERNTQSGTLISISTELLIVLIFIVAAVAGLVIFGEEFSYSKGVAMLFILAALFFMIKYQKGFGGMPGLYDFSLLLLVFFAGGMTSVTEKWFKTALVGTSTHIYTFYSFLFSILLLLVARVFIRPPR